MMATTHALFGVLLAAATARIAPEFAGVALAAAVVGSVVPDLDLYAGHRRTLHYPVYYTVFALPAIALAIALPTTGTVALALFLLGASAHSLMDVLGGGLELRPWQANSERAVYSHYHGRWVRPRRWVRYDGAPEDLAVGAMLAIPAFVTFDAPVQALVAVVLLVSTGYALLRKRLASLAETLAGALPADLHPYLPERFRASGTDSPEIGGDGLARSGNGD